MTIDINENTVFTIDDYNKIKAHADNNGLFTVNVNGTPKGKNHTVYDKFRFSAYSFYFPGVLNEIDSMIAICYNYIDKRANPNTFINLNFVIGIINDEVQWAITQ